MCGWRDLNGMRYFAVSALGAMTVNARGRCYTFCFIFTGELLWRKLDPPDEREGRVSNLELAIITLPD